MFENRDTIRFQIQEMARVEKLITDEAIQGELDTYNPLIPAAGSAERHGVPRAHLRRPAPGVAAQARRDRALARCCERGEGADAVEVRATTEEAHAAQLTREEITASVHYVRWDLSRPRSRRSKPDPCGLVVDHPAYREETELLPTTVAELLADLRG